MALLQQLCLLPVLLVTDAIKIVADIDKSWQKKWDQDITGFCISWLIPVVGTKVFFPEKSNIGIS